MTKKLPINAIAAGILNKDGKLDLNGAGPPPTAKEMMADRWLLREDEKSTDEVFAEKARATIH